MSHLLESVLQRVNNAEILAGDIDVVIDNLKGNSDVDLIYQELIELKSEFLQYVEEHAHSPEDLYDVEIYRERFNTILNLVKF